MTAQAQGHVAISSPKLRAQLLARGNILDTRLTFDDLELKPSAIVELLDAVTLDPVMHLFAKRESNIDMSAPGEDGTFVDARGRVDNLYGPCYLLESREHDGEGRHRRFDTAVQRLHTANSIDLDSSPIGASPIGAPSGTWLLAQMATCLSHLLARRESGQGPRRARAIDQSRVLIYKTHTPTSESAIGINNTIVILHPALD